MAPEDLNERIVCVGHSLIRISLAGKRSYIFQRRVIDSGKL